ncbi:MAG TPA: calcium-binding protein [Baekduia sp.]|uniref:calcium-binding protein n=1 Tax=Baekduia sp. TaxID=2600305 RepID=UPI002D77F144|nr:calcium-binding protein [Baekduia sp.]HET6510213.1 calcium-binding protein [Baekduia sp.]
MRILRPALLGTLVLGLTAATALAGTSHKGWPQIDGVLIMNKQDQSRPIDARPGKDLFANTDPSYSCDGVHEKRCADASGSVIRAGHNELLGGHGSDTIHAGPRGDVLWGDYKPSGQPSKQVDRLDGGAGRDFIYASHGTNIIHAGGGNDFIKAHYGKGIIDCGGGDDVLYVSRRAQKSYKISHCETISHKSVGY